MAISLLLPVVKSMELNLLEKAMSKVPRILDCRFSSVTSKGLFSKISERVKR
jgi:hypothetical protein